MLELYNDHHNRCQQFKNASLDYNTMKHLQVRNYGENCPKWNWRSGSETNTLQLQR